ncbi:MAG TPA: TonB family protein [Candidatus Acidoferrum sp.]|nr:TonB family protein [Candidatus Acidoferrum sp.]
MASSLKESQQQNSAAPVASAPQPKVQPVALEISVTVNGVRTVEGGDKREPFSETTQTVLVFGTGAVIRLNSGVAPGQLLFLTNEKTKKEVVCQVVKSKNYRSASGYVELEFTEPAIGFWGMRFPTDRIAPAATQSVTPAPVKPAIASAPVETKTVLPTVQAKQVVLPAPTTALPPPVAVAPPPAPVAAVPVNAAPEDSEPTAPVAPPVVDPASEELKRQTARLQEQLSSLLFEETPVATPPPAPEQPVMQLDAIAMSDATAQIFEMADPASAGTAPKAETGVAAPQKSVSWPDATVKAKTEKTPGGLHDEEVKIPSWLEPLARNTAGSPSPSRAVTPAPPSASAHIPLVSSTPVPQSQPVVKANVVAFPLTISGPDAPKAEGTQAAHESYDFGNEAKPEPIAAENQPQAPKFNSNLFGATEDTYSQEPASGGSKKGLLIGAIAATLLLGAGGGWWYMQQNGHAAAAGGGAPIVSQQSPQPATQPQAQENFQTASLPQTQPQNQGVKPFSDPAPISTQTPNNKAAQSVTPATDVQKVGNARDGVKSVPVSAATRTAEPVSQPAADVKRSAFRQLHLAAPSVKGGKTTNLSNEAEPGIAMDNAATPATGNLGLSGNSGPRIPVPVGGEVNSAQLVSSVPPVYPQLAKTQRLSGDVKIDASIDESGRVTGMKVISGPVMLHQAAMDALKQWRYKPAMLNGNPVSMHLMVTIQFRLK